MFSKISAMIVVAALLLPAGLQAAESAPAGKSAETQAAKGQKDIGPAISSYLNDHPDVVLDILRRHPVSTLRVVQEGTDKMQRREVLLNFMELKKKGKAPDVLLENRYATGAPDARTKIVVFTDFTCRFCARAHATLVPLLAAWRPRASAVFKFCPIHEDGPGAVAFQAFAAVSAKWPEKALAFSNELFSNQRRLMEQGEAFLVEAAATVGIDPAEFNKERVKKDYAKIVAEDAADSEKLGIDSTPFIFIGPIPVSGARSEQSYQDALDIAEGKDVQLPDEK